MTIRRPASSGSTDVSMRTNRIGTVSGPRSDQALADGERDRLGAAAGVELGHHVVQDVLDGALGVAELLRPPRGWGGRRRSATAPAARGRSAWRRRARRRRCLGAAREQAARAAPASRRRCRWPPRGRPRPATRASARPCAGSRPRRPAARAATASCPLSDEQTITRAPVASRTAPTKSAAARQRRVHSTRSAANSAGCSHASRTLLRIGHRLDLLEEVQARHEPPAIDRMGVQDEELHPWGWLSGGEGVAILRAASAQGKAMPPLVNVSAVRSPAATRGRSSLMPEAGEGDGRRVAGAVRGRHLGEPVHVPRAAVSGEQAVHDGDGAARAGGVDLDEGDDRAASRRCWATRRCPGSRTARRCRARR